MSLNNFQILRKKIRNPKFIRKPSHKSKQKFFPDNEEEYFSLNEIDDENLMKSNINNKKTEN